MRDLAHDLKACKELCVVVSRWRLTNCCVCGEDGISVSAEPRLQWFHRGWDVSRTRLLLVVGKIEALGEETLSYARRVLPSTYCTNDARMLKFSLIEALLSGHIKNDTFNESVMK